MPNITVANIAKELAFSGIQTLPRGVPISVKWEVFEITNDTSLAAVVYQINAHYVTTKQAHQNSSAHSWSVLLGGIENDKLYYQTVCFNNIDNIQ